ncbi:MAG: hypothetical protein JW730_08040, partial [Anaerolineales bacterium]|nr:hypothetical protein [Anaerolineales bacterium]
FWSGTLYLTQAAALVQPRTCAVLFMSTPHLIVHFSPSKQADSKVILNDKSFFYNVTPALKVQKTVSEVAKDPFLPVNQSEGECSNG